MHGDYRPISDGALPQLWWQDDGFSSRKPGFSHGLRHVRFVVEEMAWKQGFLGFFFFFWFSATDYPTIASYLPLHHELYVALSEQHVTIPRL